MRSPGRTDPVCGPGQTLKPTLQRVQIGFSKEGQDTRGGKRKRKKAGLENARGFDERSPREAPSLRRCCVNATSFTEGQLVEVIASRRGQGCQRRERGRIGLRAVRRHGSMFTAASARRHRQTTVRWKIRQADNMGSERDGAKPRIVKLRPEYLLEGGDPGANGARL